MGEEAEVDHLSDSVHHLPVALAQTGSRELNSPSAGGAPSIPHGRGKNFVQTTFNFKPTFNLKIY